MSTMRQRKHRFNKANSVISLKLPMHLVEFLNQIPDSEIRRAMNLFLKGQAMNRETIIQMAREAGLAEVTDTNQNLRQAEQALLKRYAELVNSGDAGNWYQEAELEVIAARQALALPTAEQVDDINVAESFTSVTKTAAPVGERERFEAWWRTVQMRTFPKEYDIKRLQDWGSAYKPKSLEAWQARSALSAGDAVDAQRTPLTVLQYNAIPELCAIPPSLYESVVRAIERAHGIDAAMRKDKP